MPPETLSRPLSPHADAEDLARYLGSFRWSGRDAMVEEMVIAGGLPLWREIVKLVPEALPGQRLLELGSLPFHITLLVQRLRRWAVTPTAGVIDERRRLRQRLQSEEFGEEHEFDCACFDLERETFPFESGSFDGVLFCEVIEHLAENPVFTLSEIHRVLRPGGWLLVSTPNAVRVGHLMRFALGGNPFDQYHLGSPLRGSRHSREYTLDDLRALIGGCGFRLELVSGRNLDQILYTRRTRALEPLFRLLARLCLGDHHDHLFVRAVKEGAFRWNFPSALFDEGHLRQYLDVRAAEVVVGENDVPHTSGPWGPASGLSGVLARALPESGAAVHLMAPEGCTRVEIELVATSGPATVGYSAAAHGGGGPLVSGELAVAGAPCRCEILLPAPLLTRTHLVVAVRSRGSVAMTRARAA